MKAILLTLVFVWGIISCMNAQDSLPARVTGLEQSMKNLQGSVDKINTTLTAPAVNKPAAKNDGRHLSTSQKVFVVMPVILFLILFFTLLVWLNRGGFSLASALQGDVPIKVEQPNTAITDAARAATLAVTPAAMAVAGAANVPLQINMPSNMPSTVTVSQTDQNNNPVLPQSSSRFIALFTGFAAIIIAICLVSYYVYFLNSRLTCTRF